MKLDIQPFGQEYIAPASRLLTLRNRQERKYVPALSSEYDDPAAATRVVSDLFATEGTSGVVALRNEHLVGYLLGATVFRSPSDVFAGMRQPRAAEVEHAGHAAEPEHQSTIYRELYAAMARRWVASGILGHNITVSATPQMTESWADLGFGRYMVLNGRSIESLDDLGSGSPHGVEFRQANPDDAGDIQHITTELFRTFADSPIFVPFMPETAKSRRQHVDDLLADPGCTFWLAIAGGQPVAMQLYVDPSSPQWFLGPLESTPGSVYLYLACTLPAARGTGIGAAMFAHTIRWAQSLGYRSCLVHYETPSRAATFWRGVGFEPISYLLRRSIDDRLLWAGG